VSILRAGEEEAEEAKRLTEQGDKAYRARRYSEARDCYQGALEKLSPFPEARYGLGRALEKLGKTSEAIAAYMRCRDTVDGMDPPTAASLKVAAQAWKAVTRLEPLYAELDKTDREFVKGMTDFGRRYLNAEPGWAKRAFTAARRVAPTDKVLGGLLGKVAGAREPVAGRGPFEALITEDDLPEWSPGVEQPWTCTGGIITCDPLTKGGPINFVKGRVEGSFGFRASFRLMEAKGDWTFGLVFADRSGGTHRYNLVATVKSQLILWHNKADKQKDQRLKPLVGFDPEKWHTFRVDVDPGYVACFMDGQQIFDFKDPDPEAFDGALGVYVQQARVEIRHAGIRR
jgi:tetratricopeptide (TPR) repeat protein